MKRTISIRLAVAALFATQAVCALAANFTVNMQGFQFSPRNLTINLGDTVTWVNRDATAHDTVSGTNGVPSGIWRSSLFGLNGSFSFTFTNVAPRGYGYYCTPHVFTFGMVGTITVVAPNQPPTVSISGPANGSVFAPGQPVLLQASASDPNGSVARVDFFVDGSPIGSDNSAPYEVMLNNLAPGAHVLSAVAVDNQGALSAPAVVNVSVVAGNSPPSVTITNPLNGQAFFLGAPVVVEASASDQDGSIVSVQFLTNGVSAALLASGPFSIVLSNLAVGDYNLLAIATDNEGATASSPVVTIAVGTAPQPPEILEPPQSQTVRIGDTVTFNVAAGGTPPLSYQWLFNGGNLPGATSSVLSLTNVQPSQAGAYAAQVSNSSGTVTSAPAILIVDLPPIVVITNPPNGSFFVNGSDVAVSAEVFDQDGTVTNVQFFLNDTNNPVDTLTQAPFSTVLSNLTAGIYVLFAVATDDAGAQTTSPTVTFFVRNAPIVTRTPADPSVLLGVDVLLEVAVDSTGSPVTNVVFFANGSIIGQDSSAPYSLLWEPAQIGDFVLTAVAFDEAGQTNASAPSHIRISLLDSTRPTISITNLTRLSASNVFLAGIAADNLALDYIEYQVNAAPKVFVRSNLASVRANWAAQIELQPGLNTVRVRAVDFRTNASLDAVRFFTFTIQDELELKAQEGGTVQPNLDQALLDIGKAYTVRARPKPNFLFNGWEGVSNGRSAVLTFVMQPDLKLRARFATNPFPALAGAYTGLFFDSTNLSVETSGAISLQLTKQGAFTGKLRLTEKSHAFQGQFDPLGSATLPVIRRAQRPVELALQLDVTGGSDQIRGFVTNAVGTNAELVVTPLLANKTVLPGNGQGGQPGFRLLRLSADSVEQLGKGTLSLFPGRGAQIVVLWKDQPRFFLTSSLSKFGEVPVYLSPQPGTELLLGWFQVEANGQLTPTDLYWARDGMESLVLEVIPDQ